MSKTTLARTLAASSTRGLKSPSSPKSILKRPPPLPLSPNPFPFAASFSVTLSPSVADSPHVHFPPSASLTALFSAHSPNTYDRGAIVVSPNPLEIPTWGDRIYSPTSGKFTANKKTDPGISITSPLGSPIVSITNFDAEAAVIHLSKPPPAKLQTKAGARFESKLGAAKANHSRDNLSKAMWLYPRSPYPSAPTSPGPRPEKENEDLDVNIKSPRGPARTTTVYGANPTRVSSRDRGPGTPTATAKKGKAGMTLQVPGAKPGEPCISSIPFPSPVDESLTASVAPESGSLSQAFWKSVSLGDDLPRRATTVPNPECLTPVSGVPPFVFGTKDGQLWSPGLPRKQNETDSEASDHSSTPTPTSVLSPGANRTSFGTLHRSMVMSPSPNDPFAAFPSFSAVLSLGSASELVAYPPKVFLIEDDANGELVASLD